MPTTSLISNKKIPVNERLIVALDMPNANEAKVFVEKLGPSVNFYKIGLELFMAGDYFELLDWLIARKKKIFVDLKFFDVPETVRAAVRALAKRNVAFATVHGNHAIMEAAAKDKGNIKILAVTALTSLDQGDIDDLGFKCDIDQLVLSRARRALQTGCDGVISSGIEAAKLRSELGEKLMIVCPGIRPVENKPVDDQKRTVDVAQAFNNGADYIVVGRPIRTAVDPKAAAEQIQQTVKSIFAK